MTTHHRDAPAVSARNVFEATVLSLVAGPINTEVTLALRGGDRLVAVVTTEAVAALGLAPGVSVRTLIPASQIVLVT